MATEKEIEAAYNAFCRVTYGKPRGLTSLESIAAALAAAEQVREQDARSCATCGAVLASGPQPAATYTEQVCGSGWQQKYDLLVLAVMRGSHREARDVARERFVEMHPEEKGHASKLARQHANNVVD